MQASFEAEARGKADFVRTKKKLEQDINELEIALDAANRGRAESDKNVKKLQQQISEIHQVITGRRVCVLDEAVFRNCGVYPIISTITTCSWT